MLENLWFQLYGFARNNHAVSLDLMARAAAVGGTVLVVTMDVPGHSKRTLDLFNGVTVPFRPSLRLAMQAGLKPGWAGSLLRQGQLSCPNIVRYVHPQASLQEVSVFVRDNVIGCFSWDELRTLRRAWPGKLVLKGIMSTTDALRALDVGDDAIFVSNHGGRQLDAGAASIDMLPSIAVTVAGRAMVLINGGIRSGSDVARRWRWGRMRR